MSLTEVSPRVPVDLRRMQAILSAAIAHGGPRYVIHPGDLAWWAYHSDPGTDELISYWLDEDQGFVVLFRNHNEIAAFCVPGQSPLPLIEWGQHQLGPSAKVVVVSSADHALESELEEKGYEVAGIDGPIFIHELTHEDVAPVSPSGFTLRSLTGEKEADQRRRASHAAFKSTMDPADHLERYLRLMRSPVYEAERDLVARPVRRRPDRADGHRPRLPETGCRPSVDEICLLPDVGRRDDRGASDHRRPPP